MSQIKQAVSWWCFARGDRSPESLVRAIAEIGYQGIELVGQEHWPIIKDHGLTICSTGGHASIAEGLNRRESHDRIEMEIRANIKLAVKWGIPNLIVFSGNRAGLDDETGAEIAAEGLRRVARVAEDAGVTLVMELLNSKVDHKDYMCDHTAWGIKVCRMVDSPRVRLLYDIYHMQVMEGDVIRTIQNNHRYFGHYHTAGNPGRADMDDEQELNYPAIMRAIARSGYTGFVGHEFLPKADPVDALKAAFALCDVRDGSPAMV